MNFLGYKKEIIRFKGKVISHAQKTLQKAEQIQRNCLG
jgi:hypothetical protein